jgi:hypothetical protein
MTKRLATLVVLAASLATPSAAAAPAPQPSAAAGGEHWYGYVTVEGKGSHKLPDGGQFTSHDKYVLVAPEPTDLAKESIPGKLTITIDTTQTQPDPDPVNDNCWPLIQHWSGSGTVEASLRVQSNVGGRKNYMINVDALAPITVYTETHYGGSVGGQPCSDGDTEGEGPIAPWIVIHSGHHAEVASRNGKNVSDHTQTLSCEVVSECTDFLSFQHLPTRIEAQWSLAARECTGYSRAVNLGHQDTLFVFNPCQTKSLSSRVNFLQEATGLPKICDYAYVKRLNQACNGYKAVTQIQWSQTDWFMSAATRTDACGVWVMDRASWRPPKIRPAEGPDGIEIVWINVGAQQVIKTHEGSVRVSCP